MSNILGNKFTLETRAKDLGYNVRDELIKFHDKFYSANLMGLCVLGKGRVCQPIRNDITRLC